MENTTQQIQDKRPAARRARTAPDALPSQPSPKMGVPTENGRSRPVPTSRYSGAGKVQPPSPATSAGPVPARRPALRVTTGPPLVAAAGYGASAGRATVPNFSRPSPGSADNPRNFPGLSQGNALSPRDINSWSRSHRRHAALQPRPARQPRASGDDRRLGFPGTIAEEEDLFSSPLTSPASATLHRPSTSSSERARFHSGPIRNPSDQARAPTTRSHAASIVDPATPRSSHALDRPPAGPRPQSAPTLPHRLKPQPERPAPAKHLTYLDMQPSHERGPAVKPLAPQIDWPSTHSRYSKGSTLPEIRARRANWAYKFPRPENALLLAGEGAGEQRKFVGEFVDAPKGIRGRFVPMRQPDWGSEPVPVVVERKRGVWERVFGRGKGKGKGKGKEVLGGKGSAAETGGEGRTTSTAEGSDHVAASSPALGMGFGVGPQLPETTAHAQELREARAGKARARPLSGELPPRRPASEGSRSNAPLNEPPTASPSARKDSPQRASPLTNSPISVVIDEPSASPPVKNALPAEERQHDSIAPAAPEPRCANCGTWCRRCLSACSGDRADESNASEPASVDEWDTFDFDLYPAPLNIVKRKGSSSSLSSASAEVEQRVQVPSSSSPSTPETSSLSAEEGEAREVAFVGRGKAKLVEDGQRLGLVDRGRSAVADGQTGDLEVVERAGDEEKEERADTAFGDRKEVEGELEE